MKFLTTALDDIPWVSHGFFTRLGGESGGIYNSLNCGPGSNDDQQHVAANRARIAQSMDLPPENLLSITQTHSTTAITVTKPWGKGSKPSGDAMVTDQPGIGLGILTADCTPILFASKKSRVIGAAHAGWRGALGGILEATVAAMEKLGAKPDEIEASIGPCIGPESYEVSDNFKDPFIEQNAANEKFFKPAPKPGHLIFDLPGFVAMRLKACGVVSVYDTKQDTLANETAYFSYRRTCLRGEKDYGRQLSVIALKK